MPRMKPRIALCFLNQQRCLRQIFYRNSDAERVSSTLCFVVFLSAFRITENADMVGDACVCEIHMTISPSSPHSREPHQHFEKRSGCEHLLFDSVLERGDSMKADVYFTRCRCMFRWCHRCYLVQLDDRRIPQPSVQGNQFYRLSRAATYKLGL